MYTKTLISIETLHSSHVCTLWKWQRKNEFAYDCQEKGLRIAETEENDKCTIQAHIFLLTAFWSAFKTTLFVSTIIQVFKLFREFRVEEFLGIFLEIRFKTIGSSMFSSKILHLKRTSNHLERIPARETNFRAPKLRKIVKNNDSSAVLV